jgi:thiol-disulfide isomerase/thioredoxin
MVVENYGNSELAKKFGVTRYPAIFVDDILVAKPKDFGFYGKGEGSNDGKYAPWKDVKSHERFRTDLQRMLKIVVQGEKETLRDSVESATATSQEELPSIPSFSLTDLNANPITIEEVSGRVVLVEFWATWCPPCRGTLAWLGELKKRYGDKLEILAIAVESDEPLVREVVNKMKLPIRWAMGSPEVARSFGDISAVPTMFLFDQKGKTVEIFYGAPPELHPTAEKAIDSVLN